MNKIRLAWKKSEIVWMIIICDDIFINPNILKIRIHPFEVSSDLHSLWTSLHIPIDLFSSLFRSQIIGSNQRCRPHTRAQFHQRSTYSLYACRSQKRKKYCWVISIILLFRVLRAKKVVRRTLLKLSP